MFDEADETAESAGEGHTTLSVPTFASIPLSIDSDDDEADEEEEDAVGVLGDVGSAK